MGKIVASYLVRITLRAPDQPDPTDADAPVETPDPPPTIDHLTDALGNVGLITILGNLLASISAERLDR